MACRLSLNAAFVPARENLTRPAELSISPSALRELVEREGRRVEQAIPWDKDNAEALMALGTLYHSNLWQNWAKQRAA
jgi:hypothetical protein